MVRTYEPDPHQPCGARESRGRRNLVWV